MNKATKIAAAVLLTLALLLAVLAILLARQSAPPEAAAPTAPTAAAPTFPVVVAAQVLPGGKAIESGALKVVELPIRPTGSAARIEELAGKMPARDIAVDVPVTADLLRTGLATRLADGERAVAVTVDATGAAADQVQGGDVVDVFISLREASGTAPLVQSRLLLPAVRVLAYSAPPEGAPSNASRSAVLAVPLAEVNGLMLAAQYGRLSFALRPATDSQQADAALFARPPAVVAARAGLDDAQRRRLDEPANRAYTGLSLDGFSRPGGDSAAAATPRVEPNPRPATSPAPASAPRPRQPQPAQIEIIRGGQSEVVPF